MAYDIALDLREEAVTAADIDPEGDESMTMNYSEVSEEADRVAGPAEVVSGVEEDRSADASQSAQASEAGVGSDPRRADRKLTPATELTVPQDRPQEIDLAQQHTNPQMRNASTLPTEALTPPVLPEPVSNEGDDESRAYIFAGQGRQGVDSLVSPQPRLTRLQPREKVVEVRRRRYRTRMGRYVLEFEVKRVNASHGAARPKSMWINQSDYEQLWADRRLCLDDDDHGSDEQQNEEGSLPSL
ncbi:unnamed protein product [Phytophthora fragariaefolia]|uniref:Unnamed protein product n=1 Tax=Phytophthora fragariaefolia TaxID=1490495 RepID=A0A9W6YB14_9STRA|nr:unnamed protein product [Phytophthora fragariaefolia]